MAFNKNKVMDAARKFVEKGQVDRAIKEYLRVVKEDPKDVRVWLKIGDLYAKKGAKAEATETYLKVARFYGEQGFYLKAVAVYKQILKLDARLVEVNLKLAELYRQLGLMSDAMQHFEMVAAHFHREGKTKEALATVRQLVDLDPENVATRIKLAELYSKEGMVEEAVTEFGHACEYLRVHNRQDDFLKVAERLLWHKPDDIELNRELATLYLRRKDPRRSLQKLQVCFKADPRDVETLALLAQAFQALEQKSKTVSVLKELARVLDESGQKAQAEDVHRKILMYVPDDPDSLAYLGQSRPQQVAAGSPAAAPPPGPARRLSITASDMPAAQDPRNNPTGSMPLVDDSAADDYGEPEVLEGPAVELVDEDDDFVADLSIEDEASFDTGSRAGEVHAEEIVKVLTETDVYVKYGLHQKALEHIQRVFELDPANAEARERLKEIYLAQGLEEEAVQQLLELAELAAPTDPARAELYLRELLSLDAAHAQAHDLARRFRIDLTGGPEVEIVDDMSDGIELIADDVGTGQVAAEAVEEDLDFDDLDFSDSGVVASGGEDGLDFDLDDVVDPPPAEDRSSITMEVQADQVEEMVALPDDEVEELDFDDALVEPPEPIQQPDAYAAAPAEYAPPAAPEAYPEPSPLDFDPADAAAFDADVVGARAPSPAIEQAPEAYAADDPHAFDAEPISDVSEFEMPQPAPATPAAGDYADGGATEFMSPDVLAERVGAMAGDISPPDFSGGAPDPALGDGDLDLLDDAGASTAEEAAPVDGGTSIEDDLDEADFFVTQGLYSEARDILTGLLARHPNHPLVTAKLQDVDAMEASAAGRAPSEGGFTEPTATEQVEVGEARPAVLLEKPVDEEDAETHYDLGLAYKEMGLYGEAIKSFQKVIGVPGREVQVHLMVGLCHREQGNFSEAVNQFKAGLHVAAISEPEKLSLFYEIASSYEGLGDSSEALYYYEMVYKKDPEYRDVGDRVAHLRSANGETRRSKAAPEDPDAAIDSLLAESGD